MADVGAGDSYGVENEAAGEVLCSCGWGCVAVAGRGHLGQLSDSWTTASGDCLAPSKAVGGENTHLVIT